VDGCTIRSGSCSGSSAAADGRGGHHVRAQADLQRGRSQGHRQSGALPAAINEPEEAESICLDILEVDADNQEVLVMLLLAITDQFGKNPDVGAGMRTGCWRSCEGSTSGPTTPG